MLQDAGIDGLLLKGPTLQPMWGDEPRPYSDVDVMVHPSQHPVALQLLLDAGFRLQPSLGPATHATTVDREGDAPVDLHHTLAMSGIDSAPTVEVLRRGAHRDPDGLLRPTQEATACIAILHAAQNHAGAWKSSKDVGHVAADTTRVAAAAAIASELHADHQLRVGLWSHPAGQRAAKSLAIAPPSYLRTVFWQLRREISTLRFIGKSSGPAGLVRYAIGTNRVPGQASARPQPGRWPRLTKRLLRISSGPPSL
jgi:hypothetical protein